jgi:hypothetical protein
VHYLVGTPKGRLTRLERHLVAQPWQEARPGVQRCYGASGEDKASSSLETTDGVPHAAAE